MNRLLRLPVLAVLLALLGTSAVRALAQDAPSTPPPDPPPYSNPVVAGDFPDPSAVRIGPEYWAIATASSGQPSPPILRSPDLVNWTLAGYLFAEPPPWSSGRQLWGPSLERFGDRYLVYYSARKKYGRPCVTVGESTNPIGPYIDHGPLVCQRNASIDPSVVHNNHGRPYLVWKENGGSHPSSIWTQPLTFDGLQLTGEPHKIMVGSRHSWEGGLVEGPRIIRRRGWLYLFYSGGRCCAPTTCRYALGVARARSIYGPWRRAKKNPILKSTNSWKCPGTGAILQTPSGHWWVLYHGYRARGSTSGGREMLLDLLHWTHDGWPFIDPGSRPAGDGAVAALAARSIPFRHIARGDGSASAVTKTTRLVIRDAAAWRRLWRRLHAGVMPQPPLPKVDFARHMLLAVSTGRRNSGGYSIRVESIVDSGRRLTVSTVERAPGAGCTNPAVLTAPYDVVRVRRTAKSVRFTGRVSVYHC